MSDTARGVDDVKRPQIVNLELEDIASNDDKSNVEKYIERLENQASTFENWNSNLIEERDQLAASNARWMKAYVKLTNDQRCCPDDTWVYCADSDLIREFDHIAESTPQQSLAEIQARAVDGFREYFDKEYYGEDLSPFIEKYAYMIRHESKEKTK